MTRHEVVPGWSVGACAIFPDVLGERFRQLQKWGPQAHPDGTGSDHAELDANFYRQVCEDSFAVGEGTWEDILLEEVYEALAETEREPLREELVQVAAVVFAWIQDIDNRAAVPAVVPDPDRELVAA